MGADQRGIFFCPVCGRAVRPGLPSGVWHALNVWHNPWEVLDKGRRMGLRIRPWEWAVFVAIVLAVTTGTYWLLTTLFG